jgi:hypothetical protein
MSPGPTFAWELGQVAVLDRYDFLSVAISWAPSYPRGDGLMITRHYVQLCP